ncbi:MAG TPA: cell division protein FtsL [Coxiellaceae bacterium]|nr:cell division protein FtsL [Coxiellaceae bacterium]
MTRAVYGFNWLLWRRRDVKTVISTLQQRFFVGVLVVSLLLSAFSVIYLKDLSRRLFIHYQQLQTSQAQSETEWNKLLLEKGAWSTQARIQYLATQRLNMITPADNQIKIIN